MIYKVYSIFDSKLEAYMLPQCRRSRGEVLREFTDAVNNDNPDNGIGKHPEDFHLFEIGEYDDQTGMVQSCTPVSLGCAIEFVKVVD